MSNCYLSSLIRGGWTACLHASRQLASASAVAVADTLSNTQASSAILPAAYSQAAAKRHASTAAAGGPDTTPQGRCARASVLDGRAVAAAWERELVGEVAHLTDILGRPPGLGVVLVGSRPDSMLYVSKKQEACQKVGMGERGKAPGGAAGMGRARAACCMPSWRCRMVVCCMPFRIPYRVLALRRFAYGVVTGGREGKGVLGGLASDAALDAATECPDQGNTGTIICTTHMRIPLHA